MLEEEKRLKRYLCVSLETQKRKIGHVTVFPYKDFLEALWGGEFQ